MQLNYGISGEKILMSIRFVSIKFRTFLQSLFVENYLKIKTIIFREVNKTKSYEWILRIGIFGSFLGHGIFALAVKQSWIPYLTAVGFSESTAAALLPLIGTLDILVALFALFWPLRIVLIWATIWAFATALIRPIAGEPIWDFVERSANWAAPLALLAIQGFPKKAKDFLKK
ncbi:MAG: hypothetical protein QT08_C0017G0002 [archaeon GW2011_AR17]|nr:MAG: hypothetical protein QT08_C0017G0002 [archaeon GW2011_AR17]